MGSSRAVSLSMAAPISNVQSFDQRGFNRPVDGEPDGTATCDIGAYELSAAFAADIAAFIDITSSSANVGDRYEYRITVKNLGSATASDVTLVDTLPPTVNLVSATPSRGSCSGTPVLACKLGSFGNGAAATVTIAVIPTQAGTLTNSARVSATPDADSSNNVANVATTVGPNGCGSRPPVVTQVSKVDQGRLRGTVSAVSAAAVPSNRVLEVHFGVATNAIIDVPVQSGISAPVTGVGNVQVTLRLRNHR